MEDCRAMHLCWTYGPLHRQKLILASAKAGPIWDFSVSKIVHYINSEKGMDFHLIMILFTNLIQTSHLCLKQDSVTVDEVTNIDVVLMRHVSCNASFKIFVVFIPKEGLAGWASPIFLFV